MRSFNEMLARLEAERRESGRRALAAQEGERKRVAAELHDEVGQTMTGVLLLLERVAGEVPPERREVFVEVQDAVPTSLDDVRRIAEELRPELLEHLGLVSALKFARAEPSPTERVSSSMGLCARAAIAVTRHGARRLPNRPGELDQRCTSRAGRACLGFDAAG